MALCRVVLPNPSGPRRLLQVLDPGEIAVPRAMLSKKGPLTRDEILQVQQHPIVGHRILRRSSPTLTSSRPPSRITSGGMEVDVRKDWLETRFLRQREWSRLPTRSML